MLLSKFFQTLHWIEDVIQVSYTILLWKIYRLFYRCIIPASHYYYYYNYIE